MHVPTSIDNLGWDGEIVKPSHLSYESLPSFMNWRDIAPLRSAPPFAHSEK
jgi:hypothetical protein